MKIKVEERERNACRIRSELLFSVAKHRGSETRGSEMSLILVRPWRYNKDRGELLSSKVVSLQSSLLI